MPARSLILALVLIVSACAQLPSEPTQRASEQQPKLQITESASVAPADTDANQAVADSSPKSTAAPATSAPRSSRTAPAPRLQSADRLPPAPTIAVAAAPPSPPKDVWTRIRHGFALSPMENDLVREWENWYSSRPDYVGRMIDRSSRFLFHIVEEVEKRNMPMEIALLPMIESAYNPVAYSRAHASGIWQFIPSTGKHFGLRQNWWYDGRRDVIAATTAALDYLEKLHGMFGDWPLALASYNWGEGAVGRAMERNRAKGLATDYESLTVPGETRNYLPKLIAVKNIISNPARYGLQLADVPNEPYFETILVKQHIDLKIAAKFAELPLDEFKFLNPGHNKPVIRAGEAERIVLPKHRVATFLANFAKRDTPLLSWQAVTLRSGEKVEKVAAQHGMTLAELKQVNGLNHQKRIVIGQPLLVPLKAGGADAYLPDLPATPVAMPKAIEAAKQAAASRRYVQHGRGTGAVQQAVQRITAQKGSKHPVRPLLAENGKRVKVVASKAPSSKKTTTVRTTQRTKLASR